MLENKSINEVACYLMEIGKHIDSSSAKFTTYYKIKRTSDTNAKLTKRRNVEFYNEFLEREFLLPSSCPSNSLMTPVDKEIVVLNPDNGTSSYVIAEIANELEAEM